MSKKIKVLAYMDSPSVATGFATVSRNILMGLHQTGLYDIEVLGINYWGFPHPFPFPINPVGINNDNDPYGRKWSSQVMMEKEYDVLFTLQDSFILEFVGPLIDQLRARNPKLKWITYFPIDGRPKKRWLEAMNKADSVVTYTEWGKSECIEVLPELESRLQVVPHGANTTDFFPLQKSEAIHFKRDYFGEHANKFVVLNVNRNQQRKDLPRSMLAFKKFQEKHPDSFYYIHCAVNDHGWALEDVCESLGLEINKDIGFPQGLNPNQGFPIDVVNRLYNACDVVISTTTGEGWGLAQTEAMACCKPVISPDNTACTEIVKGRGFLVPSGEKFDSNLVTVLPNDNEVLRSLTDINALAEMLCYVKENPTDAANKAFEGYKWVSSSLRWDKNIVPLWLKIFEETLTVQQKPSLDLTSL